jgi:hypothetical protein
MNERQLDMVLEYLNTGIINEGLFNKFKKKPQSQNKKGTIQKRNDVSWELNDKICEAIKNILKKLLTSSYKKSIADDLNKAYNDGDITDVEFKNPSKNNYSSKNLPDFVVEPMSVDTIQVIEASQCEMFAIGWVLDDIIKELKKIPEFKDINFDSGDGDEGCIYF